ncbi:NAD-binding protein [Geobacter sulfurreducens]|jgi:voltage-gated potassium channel|uniref:TrkA domain protein n=1 Tax=Geobacter sulfurreducens (strain ATCC 51573 / DSM 12127 / PCA) TaxID=243231 RepID=Q74FS9_GEOSL|nr:NAD-binding protein [Geobacter sulfurreducens]AAR33858.1 TrkA domain protein [Geobacter sulfurreducens PCA]ADI83379.1 TrkA domain protein [Geobacter sulfurreducens KN400]AJY70279.1 potassium transporter TrkA [Geobacter sulfurreducens]QVW35783.1 NAD-binding protein [Geobacter sulfurreducens]UAC04604.1 NAD-binding protein [Geobacter sulfurreducens]
MKVLASELAYFLRGRARQNLKVLLLYCAFLLVMLLAYASIFRYLMWHLEGREYSFMAGIYWTITVMTTLGFGDITFQSDAGYLFASIVTVSGVIFLLIILPFGFVSMFLAPWIERRLRYHPTIELPDDTRGHILIFGIDPITRTLIRKLESRNHLFVVVTDNYDQALHLEEQEGFKVVYGSPTDAHVLAGLRVAAARSIIANLSDPDNANLCLTVRSLCQTPIIAVVKEPVHGELLRLAGANQVVPLTRILGRYLGIRATTCGALAHILDSFGNLQIAELPVHGTPFAGKTIGESGIRQRTGLSIIGVWERGSLTTPQRETVLTEQSLLVLAGTKSQLAALEYLIGEAPEDELIFIIGHGRIGCAAAAFLDRKPVPFILIDRQESPVCNDHVVVYGDATVGQTLRQAGIDRASGIIVTTNDDSTNIFLTLACRHLHSHIRIVARANGEENVDQLYAAGADFVVSNASVGANILGNLLEHKESAFLSEGMAVFRRPLPPAMAGKTIAETRLRPLTGCSIVAIEAPDRADILISPPPETILAEGARLILIGTSEQEKTFDQTIAAR